MLLTAIVPDSLCDAIQAQKQDRQVWLVGGAIRDHILGRPILDLDFAVSDGARKLARTVADELNAPYFQLDASRDVGRIVHRYDIDFVKIRGDSIEADLRDRDFTINSLAIPFDDPDHVIDKVGGIQDLKDGILRATVSGAFRADPIRAIRAVRLAVEYGLSIDKQSLAEIKQVHKLISLTSMERVRDELMRILRHSDPSIAIRMMERLQQLHSVLIDVEPLKQVSDDQATGWEATLGIIQGLSQIMLVLGFPFKQHHSGDLTLGKLSAKLGRYRQHVSMHLERLLAGERTARQSLFLAALMLSVKTHPCAGYEDLACSSKLAYEKALKLKLSRHEARVVGELIALQEPLSRLEATRRSAYHFCREGGESAVAAVLLNLACFLACHKPSPVQKEWDEKLDTARSVLDLAFEEEPQPVIRGNELAQELGIEPGPILGELLEAIREGQMMGEVADRDSALAIAAQRLKKFKEKSL